MQQNDAFEFKQTPPRDSNNESDETNYRCGNCISCFRVVDCRKCDNCLQDKQPCLRRVCIQLGLPAEKLKPDLNALSQQNAPKKKGRPPLPKPPKVEKKRGRPLKQDGSKRTYSSKPKQDREQKSPRRLLKKSDKLSTQNSFIEDIGQPRHCLGPKCIKAARQGSKYCSQECGIALAEKRIAVVLPQRLKEFYEEKPAGEINADARLADLIQKRKEVEERLQKTNEYRENFDCYIKALADKIPSPHGSPNNKKQPTGEVTTCFCFVCGSEMPIVGSVQHTRRCFERLEKQSSFGTSHKFPVNPFNILCETHDKQTKTYCKRLRVVCPEHYKDDIGKQMKICGFPLVWEDCYLKNLDEMLGKTDIFTGRMCPLSRNQCSEHKMWEQNVAALIDNLRMAYLLQIDNLIETYNKILVGIQSHYNGLLHLFSKTTVNDPDTKSKETTYVNVEIDDVPTESQLAGLHL